MSLASLRHAVYGLRVRPSLTMAAIATIGLAVGTATAIYSAVQAVLLTPLPFAAPDRLVMVWETDLKKGASVVELSHREFDAFRDRATVFDGLAAVTAANLRVNLTGRGDAVQVEASLISPGFFGALGVAPLRGRDFGDSERTDTTGARVLISEGLWRRHYGADEALVGRDVNVGGSPATVVGVMPPGMLPRNVDIWISTAGLAEGAPDLGVLKLVGRMKPGVTLETARANLEVVSAGLAREQPARGSLGAHIVPLADQIYGQTRPALRLLVAAVACLLLIACANVANLLLARGVDREREFAVRAAMGASGRRLAAQLFGESLALGVLGGGAGVLIASWAISLIGGLIPADVPGIDRLAIDWRVLGVALGAVAGRRRPVRHRASLAGIARGRGRRRARVQPARGGQSARGPCARDPCRRPTGAVARSGGGRRAGRAVVCHTRAPRARVRSCRRDHGEDPVERSLHGPQVPRGVLRSTARATVGAARCGFGGARAAASPGRSRSGGTIPSRSKARRPRRRRATPTPTTRPSAPDTSRR